MPAQQSRGPTAPGAGCDCGRRGVGACARAEGGQMTHVLVTNDFPPKVGGIQSYLWELWRRLPPDRFGVLTTPHAGAEAFDVVQPFRVERTRQRVLLPTPALAARVRGVAAK